MVETRAAPRHRVMKPAKIEFGGYKRECVIRDISTSGAALEVMDQASIPRHFTLIVPEDLRLICERSEYVRTLRDLGLDWFHSPVPVERLTAC
jgi:hypothetical protein